MLNPCCWTCCCWTCCCCCQERKDPAAQDKEWGEFLHMPGQRVYDFTEIRSVRKRAAGGVPHEDQGRGWGLTVWCVGVMLCGSA